MTASQIKAGIAVILAQLILLGMTLGFQSSMDRQAQADGISIIIERAGK